jgi:hypothetical protein
MPGCFKPYQMQQKGRRPENPDPRGPVPQDLIELQPSYAQVSSNARLCKASWLLSEVWWVSCLIIVACSFDESIVLQYSIEQLGVQYTELMTFVGFVSV